LELKGKISGFFGPLRLDVSFSKMEPELSRANETIGARGDLRYIPDDD
jgi:hypothetical protein